MQHYTFTITFRALYDKAVAQYARGQRGADTFFSPEERAFLAANGIAPQHLYDYAEDANNDGEPDFGTAVGVELIRRDYFLNVQNGRPPATILDPATLPPKDVALEGITWLPRILPKAQAKLKGELPPSLMYGCGGDRNFFSTHDIHPAEFLRLVWTHLENPAALVAWVKQRSGH
jgi:hypothetical protein